MPDLRVAFWTSLRDPETRRARGGKIARRLVSLLVFFSSRGRRFPLATLSIAHPFSLWETGKKGHFFSLSYFHHKPTTISVAARVRPSGTFKSARNRRARSRARTRVHTCEPSMHGCIVPLRSNPPSHLLPSVHSHRFSLPLSLPPSLSAPDAFVPRCGSTRGGQVCQACRRKK